MDRAVVSAVDVGDDGRVSRPALQPSGRQRARAGKRVRDRGPRHRDTEAAAAVAHGGAPARRGELERQVGRNLMDHPSLLSWAMADGPLGPIAGRCPPAGSSRHGRAPGEPRYGSFRVQLGNRGWAWSRWHARNGSCRSWPNGDFGVGTYYAQLQNRSARELELATMVEQLPSPENRIVPDEEGA